MTNIKLSHRLLFFIAIGGTASVVNLGLVLLLVHFRNFNPLIANIIAYLIAFNVSFFGHKYLTFAQLQDQKQLRLPYFFLVATSAGLLNEFLYFLLLQFTQLNYLVALFIVLILVAVYTFFMSRFWACR